MPLGLGAQANSRPKGAAASLSFDARIMNLKRLRKLCQSPGAERKPDDILRLCEVTASLCHFFRTMPLQMHKEVCRSVELELYGKGEVVFRQGDVGDKFYVIVQGRLEVLVRENPKSKRQTQASDNDNGAAPRTLPSTTKGPQDNKLTARDVENASVVATLFRGDTFGEIALVKDGFRTATIFTKTKSELLVLRKDDFQRILHSFYGTSLEDRLFFLRRLNTLSHTDEEQIMAFAHFLCVAAHQEGTIFYPAQDNRIHFIVEGECKLRLDYSTYGPPTALPKINIGSNDAGAYPGDAPARESRYAGKEHFYDNTTISRLGPGNCFGECCVFPSIRREGWVGEALSEVKLYFVAQADIQSNTDPRIVDALQDEALFKCDYYDGRFGQLMASRELLGISKGGRRGAGAKTSKGGANRASLSPAKTGTAGNMGANAEAALAKPEAGSGNGDGAAGGDGAGPVPSKGEDAPAAAAGADATEATADDLSEMLTQEEINKQEDGATRFLEALATAGKREMTRLAHLQANQAQNGMTSAAASSW